MTHTQIEVKDYGYFAGNQWRKATDDQFFEVHEPYSGQLFARVAAGSRADARAAVDAAAKAFPAWAESTPAAASHSHGAGVDHPAHELLCRKLRAAGADVTGPGRAGRARREPGCFRSAR